MRDEIKPVFKVFATDVYQRVGTSFSSKCHLPALSVSL